MALRPDRATRFRDRVSILRRAEVARDRYGNPVDAGAFAVVGQRWGQVREVGGGEALAGGALESREQATVILRLDALTRTLGDAERVRFRGEDWNIIRRIEVGFSHREVELTCRKLPGAEVAPAGPAALLTAAGEHLLTAGGDRLVVA